MGNLKAPEQRTSFVSDVPDKTTDCPLIAIIPRHHISQPSLHPSRLSCPSALFAVVSCALTCRGEIQPVPSAGPSSNSISPRRPLASAPKKVGSFHRTSHPPNPSHETSPNPASVNNNHNPPSIYPLSLPLNHRPSRPSLPFTHLHHDD
jgi:hypothetical protein